MGAHNRGDIFVADLPGLGLRPVVITTRQEAIDVLTNVTVVLITTTMRGHSAEISLDPSHGLDEESVANCDNMLTLPKSRLGKRIGSLRFEDLRRLDRAVKYAQGLT